MIPLPLARIAEITSGALTGMADPGAVVHGPVVIDSSAAEPGSLFVAIKGERVDGHDFAQRAHEAGAAAVLAARPVEAPAVIVGDVLVDKLLARDVGVWRAAKQSDRIDADRRSANCIYVLHMRRAVGLRHRFALKTSVEVNRHAGRRFAGADVNCDLGRGVGEGRREQKRVDAEFHG